MRRLLFLTLALFPALALAYGSYFGFPKAWDFTALTVNGSPVVTQATQPPFRGALAARAASQSINTGAITAVQLDTELYDTDNIHDNVTSNTRLVVPAGVSRIRLTGQVWWSPSTTGWRTARVYLNGTELLWPKIRAHDQPLHADEFIQEIAGPVIDATPGDFYEMRVQQTSGGALSIYAQGTYLAMEVIE